MGVEHLIAAAWNEDLGIGMVAAGPSKAQREEWAKKGWALPGGRYPIPNRAYLEKAIGALGRAAQHGDYERIKSWVIRRARQLNAVKMLPEDWGVTASGGAGDGPLLISVPGEWIDRVKIVPVTSSAEDDAAVTAAMDARQAKIAKVMREFAAGRLKSSSGETVTDRKQALAIAMSEARRLTAAAFDESKHPRHPRGSRGGGQFRALDEIAEATGDPEDRALAQAARGATPEEQAAIKQVLSEGWGDATQEERDLARTALERSGYKGVSEWYAPSDAPGGSEMLAHTPTAEEAADYEAGIYDDIERRAQPYIEQGYEPSDSEPGEWLELTHPETGDVVMIDADEEYDQGGESALDIGYVGGPVEDLSDKDLFDQITRAEASPVTTSFQERLIDLRREADRRIKRVHGETAAVLTAAAAGLVPLHPPKTWFDNPELEGPTPVTITADGRVYGHAATWGTCHTGISGQCRTPPRSQSGYRYFHLGELETEDGPVHVGRVTMDTGHSPLTASRSATIRHYDDTGTGAAHVRVGEDDHGIWVAGALSPELPAEKVRTLRAAALSGDWRSVNGQLELVGMLAVNVPGFPVPRAMAAAMIVEDEPQTMALVAAGVYCAPAEVDRKIRALTARAQGVDSLLEMAMGGPDEERRRRAMRASAEFRDPAPSVQG